MSLSAAIKQWGPQRGRTTRLNLCNSYEYDLVETMVQNAVHRLDYVTEKEVFIGTILGTSGAASKRQREQSDVMKERYSRDVRDIVRWIQGKEVPEGEGGENTDSPLALPMACLYQGLQTQKQKIGREEVELRSFGWIAAGVCMREIDKMDNKFEDGEYY